MSGSSLRQSGCYTVCKLSELKSAQSDPTGSLLVAGDGRTWRALDTHRPLEEEEKLSLWPRCRFNRKGRFVLELTEKGREIVVYFHAKTREVFAYDRNCYHVGYPLDMGEIEEIPIAIQQRRGRQHRIPQNALTGGERNEEEEEEDNKGFDEDVLVLINCPLHNRIFDLRTGDLMQVSFAETQEKMQEMAAWVDDKITPHHTRTRNGQNSEEGHKERRSSTSVGMTDASAVGDDEGRRVRFPVGVYNIVTEGKRKGGVPCSSGCHQRTHRVELVPIPTVDNDNRGGGEDYWVRVIDSGTSITADSSIVAGSTDTRALCVLPGSKEAVPSDVELGKIISDKYNR